MNIEKVKSTYVYRLTTKQMLRWLNLEKAHSLYNMIKQSHESVIDLDWDEHFGANIFVTVDSDKELLDIAETIKRLLKVLP